MADKFHPGFETLNPTTEKDLKESCPFNDAPETNKRKRNLSSTSYSSPSTENESLKEENILRKSKRIRKKPKRFDFSEYKK